MKVTFDLFIIKMLIKIIFRPIVTTIVSPGQLLFSVNSKQLIEANLIISIWFFIDSQ